MQLEAGSVSVEVAMPHPRRPPEPLEPLSPVWGPSKHSFLAYVLALHGTAGHVYGLLLYAPQEVDCMHL